MNKTILSLTLTALLVAGCSRPPAPARFSAQPGTLLHFVPVAEKLVALSFDDGPNDPCTRQLLDVLAKENVHATFMLIGANAVKHPDIVQQIAAAGHAIGNHSYSHPRFDRSSPNTIREEITKNDVLLEKLTGAKPLLMRPPYGLYGPDYFEICRATGHVIGGWSASAGDWNPHTPQELTGALLDQLAPGAIFLLHDGKETNDGPHRVASVQAVAQLIPQVKARGYRFVTIPELLAQATAPLAAFENGAHLLAVQWPDMRAGTPELIFRFHWQLPAGLDRRATRAWLRVSQNGREFGWYAADLPGGADVWKETETIKVRRPPTMTAGNYTVELCLTRGGHRAWQRLAVGSNLPTQRRRITLPNTLVLAP
ncbi:MAG: polysaccharide deacetylase family protein [Verrucomicrobia bacterium]|nr:MAG: polysaccharide deacetylase family protein [Verrucomicrobiota bacterium]